MKAEDRALGRVDDRVESIEPEDATGVIVKTPPSRSASVILPSRARLAASAMFFLDISHPERFAIAYTGT